MQVSEKDFRRLDKFNGTGWKGWSYQSKGIVTSISTELHGVFEEVETNDQETGAS